MVMRASGSTGGRLVWMGYLMPLLLLPWSCAEGGFQGHVYTSNTACSNGQATVLGSSDYFQTFQTRSRLHCVVVCSTSPSCRSVVHDADSGSCHLGTSHAWPNCSNMAAARPSQIYFESLKDCQNGGVWTPEDNTCSCQEPFYGEMCHLILRDCYDVRGLVGDEDGLAHPHVIHPASLPHPINVSCHTMYSRLYVFVHNIKKTDMNRTWEEYVNGFGDVASDHWLGLEPLHHITQAGRVYRLKVEVVATNDTSWNINYVNFTLSNSSQGYTFSADMSQMNRILKNCFHELVGQPFSAYDHDNDGSENVNCAHRHGCGWWFKGDNCVNECHPLGVLSFSKILWSGQPTDTFWEISSAERMSLKRIKMFIQ